MFTFIYFLTNYLVYLFIYAFIHTYIYIYITFRDPTGKQVAVPQGRVCCRTTQRSCASLSAGCSHSSSTRGSGVGYCNRPYWTLNKGPYDVRAVVRGLGVWGETLGGRVLVLEARVQGESDSILG